MNTLLRSTLLVALLALLGTTSVYARGAPVLNIENAPVVTISGKPATLEAIGQAIRIAVINKGWTPGDMKPGLVSASIVVRGKHQAAVDIPYTTTSYSIKYASSSGLSYDAEKNTIHRNYNNWVTFLQRAINAEMLRSLK